MSKQSVIINGRMYDSVTGLPVEGEIVSAPNKKPLYKKIAPNAESTRGAATSRVHKSQTKHSTTLNRRHVKHPTRKPLASRKRLSPEPVQRHAQIRKYHSPIIDGVTSIKDNSPDRPAETHPLVHRAKARRINSDMAKPIKKNPAHQVEHKNSTKENAPKKALKSAQILKNDAIAEAMSREIKSPKVRRTKKPMNKFNRWLSFASAGVAVMLLGGYLTYLCMPNISIRIAALQSGINAKLPGYNPSGYALRGPINFKQGEVRMKFAYADGNTNYTLTQQKSDWDSAAVKEYITKRDGAPITTTVDGLTIYTNGNDSAWVNGGVFYTIDGSAPLSSDQIQRIATSL